MPARDEQDDERQLDRRVVEQRRVEVRLEVVDADERDVPREGQRLGRRHADEQGADQAGPDRAGDGVDAPVLDPGLDDRPGDHRVEQVEVGPAGDLRDDAAERGVQLDLRADDARQDVAAAHHERRGRLVAARLDAEHERVRSHVAVVGERQTVDLVIGHRCAAPRGVGRRRPSGCRGTTSRWRPRCPRSTGRGCRPARSRTSGTAPGPPVLLARTSSVQAWQPRSMAARASSPSSRVAIPWRRWSGCTAMFVTCASPATYISPP